MNQEDYYDYIVTTNGFGKNAVEVEVSDLF